MIHKYKFWLSHNKKMTYEHTLDKVCEVIKEFTDDIIPLPFIGVVDSKNREIYLGDICNVRGGETHQGMSEIDITGVVEFAHGGYYLKTSKNVCYSFGIMDYDTIYILGNIYEHPEFYKAWNKTT
jgi:hypothetical protein